MDKNGLPCVLGGILKASLCKKPAKHPLHFSKSGAELCMTSWSQPSNFGSSSQVKHTMHRPGSVELNPLEKTA
jgi:hypothetical protein